MICLMKHVLWVLAENALFVKSLLHISQPKSLAYITTNYRLFRELAAINYVRYTLDIR